MSDNVFSDGNPERVFDIARNMAGTDKTGIAGIDNLTDEETRAHSIAATYVAETDTLLAISTVPVMELIARGEFDSVKALLGGLFFLLDHVENHEGHAGPKIWEDYKSQRDAFTMFQSTMNEIDSL